MKRTGIMLALLTWCTYALLIDSHDLRAYNLQHAGIEAIAERGTFELGGSETPGLKNPGDTFRHRGKLIAAKQPGQFVFGAMPYSVLHAIGITYRSNYELTAALTTWLSSDLATASAVYALWLLLTSIFQFGSEPAAKAALSYGLGSTITAYCGIPHHDVIACALLIWAWYFIEASAHARASRLIAAGVCLGLVLWSSFLEALIVGAMLAYGSFVAWSDTKSMRDTAWAVGRLAAGFAIGLLPLAAYNWHYFDNPFLQANVAGAYSDTFFDPSVARFWDHLSLYVGTGRVSIWKFVPMAAAGAIGVIAFPKRLARQRLFICLAVLLHFGYLLGIETNGHCQYGPRYLMPVEVLLVVGVAHVSRLSERARLVSYVLNAVLFSSVVINVVGALGGTMTTLSCWKSPYAFRAYLEHFSMLTAANFPLRSIGVVTLGSLLLFDLAISTRLLRRAPLRGDSSSQAVDVAQAR